MHKLGSAIAATALVFTLGSGPAPAAASASSAGSSSCGGEAWSPEGQGRYVLPEAWSPEGRAPACSI